MSLSRVSESVDAIGVHGMPDILAPQPKRRRTIREKQCTHCGRTFKRTEHLERHVRTRSYSTHDILYRIVSDPKVPVKIQRRSLLRVLVGRRSRDEIFSRDTTRWPATRHLMMCMMIA